MSIDDVKPKKEYVLFSNTRNENYRMFYNILNGCWYLRPEMATKLYVKEQNDPSDRFVIMASHYSGPEVEVFDRIKKIKTIYFAFVAPLSKMKL